MKFIIPLLTVLVFSCTSVFAQEFQSIEELKHYVHTHDDFKKRMVDGWYKIYYVEHHNEEKLVEAYALLHDGFIAQVYTKDASFILRVQSNHRVHHGTGIFFDLVYEESDNMAEVIPYKKFHAYFVKSQPEPDDYTPTSLNGHWVAWTDWSGINKHHGFFIFLKDDHSEEFKLVGYLDKHNPKQPASCVPSQGDWLYLPLKQGDYEYLAVKNSIKMDRHMPKKTGKLKIKSDNCPKLYLSKKLKKS